MKNALVSKSAYVFALGLTVALGIHETVSAEDSARTKVGVSVIGLTNPYENALADLVARDASAAGFDVQVVDGRHDVVKQIDDITTMLSSGAKGIMITPADGVAIKVALERAEKAGVPVVAIDTGPSEGAGKALITVTASSLVLGRESCLAIGDALAGKGKVLEIQGSFKSQVGIDRSKGFNDCIAEKYPDIEVVSRQSEWVPENAASIAQTVLSTDGDITGIYMAGESAGLSGVISAMRRLGKLHKVGEEGHIAIVGIDGTPFALGQIREGYVDAVVGQPLDGDVKWAVQHLKNAMEGKLPQPGPTEYGSEIISRADGHLIDLLPPTLITKQNVDTPTLWGNQSSN